MSNNNLNVFLSGEIHTDWREEIIDESKNQNLTINFFSPETNHANSDDCGVSILGPENDKFWHDYKGASINSINNSICIKKSDIVIIKFGEKYKQWNAAFDAGYASALNKSLIIMHSDEHQHALKEVDAAALAVTKNVDEIVNILQYSVEGSLEF